ncbi:unnamed protein product, partial [Ectocarpus sp. 8 AP-2014]
AQGALGPKGRNLIYQASFFQAFYHAAPPPLPSQGGVGGRKEPPAQPLIGGGLSQTQATLYFIPRCPRPHPVSQDQNDSLLQEEGSGPTVASQLETRRTSAPLKAPVN